MGTDTYPHADVKSLISENFVAVHLDSDKNQPLVTSWSVSGLPDCVILQADGTVLTRVTGFQPPADFAASLRKAIAGGVELQAAQKAADAAPTDAAALARLARAQNDLGRTAEARKSFEAFLAADPENQSGMAAEAHYRIGVIALQAGAAEEGAAALAKVKEADPKNEKGFADDVLIETGLAALRKGEELHHSDHAASEAALKTAIELLDTLLRDHPASDRATEATFCRAYAMYTMHDETGAIAALRALAEKHPDDKWGKQAGEALKQLGK